MSGKDFITSTGKLAIAIFLALLGFSGAWALWGKVERDSERRSAEPFEVVKPWSVDLRGQLGTSFTARTKLVNGELFTNIKSDNYPGFLANPALKYRNANGSITLEFLDSDGFKVFTKSIGIKEFTSIVNAQGVNSQIEAEFDEPLSVDKYRRFSNLAISWSLVTVTPNSPASDDQPSSKPDPCTPGLSKSERLKRLSQHGTTREVGLGEYSAGDHSIVFSYDGSLVSCR